MNPVSVGWGHLIHLTRPVARMRQLPRLSSPFFLFFVTENSQKFWVIRPFGSATGPRLVWLGACSSSSGCSPDPIQYVCAQRWPRAYSSSLH